jgi:hypothetical protein
VRRAAPAVLLACAAIAGCGEGGEDPGSARQTQEPARVTAGERRLLDTYDSRIAAHCVRVSRSLTDPSSAPTRAQSAAAFGAARALLALAARKPGAPLGAGQDLRLFVSDVIENLEGSNCDPRMIAVLSEGLEEIPAG